MTEQNKTPAESSAPALSVVAGSALALEKYVPPAKPYKGKWTVEERRRYARERAREIALRRRILEQQQRRLEEEYDKCISMLKALQSDVATGRATLQPERLTQIYDLIPCPPNVPSEPRGT